MPLFPHQKPARRHPTPPSPTTPRNPATADTAALPKTVSLDGRQLRFAGHAPGGGEARYIDIGAGVVHKLPLAVVIQRHPNCTIVRPLGPAAARQIRIRNDVVVGNQATHVGSTILLGPIIAAADGWTAAEQAWLVD